MQKHTMKLQTYSYQASAANSVGWDVSKADLHRIFVLKLISLQFLVELWSKYRKMQGVKLKDPGPPSVAPRPIPMKWHTSN
jgi:hypothetical protein